MTVRNLRPSASREVMSARWVRRAMPEPYRAVAAGFYGSLTQYFAQLHAERRATWAATLIVPGVAHLVELGVHAWAGTPVLGWSVAGSIAFSMMSTRFNLFAMRRGALTVGHGSASWWQDLRAMPAMVAAFFRG